MGIKSKIDRSQIELLSLDDLVPKNHLVRKLEKAIDLDFILEPCINLFGNEVSHPEMISFNYFKDEMKIFKKEENRI